MKTKHCHSRRSEAAIPIATCIPIEPTTANVPLKLIVRLSIVAVTLFFLSNATPLVHKCSAEELAAKKSTTESTTTDKSDSETSNDAGSETSRKGSERMTTVYDFKEKAIDGNEIDFSTYKGDVLLIVNTASECGFTPQYKGLEALHKKFEGQGLKILGFPCNQFGHQEPGDSKAIASFCEKNFGVTFQLFEKVDVKGKSANPLFKYLTDAAPGVLGSKGIKWNFTKFLVDRKGNVVKRFGPNVEPEKLIPELETVLK